MIIIQFEIPCSFSIILNLTIEILPFRNKAKTILLLSQETLAMLQSAIRKWNVKVWTFIQSCGSGFGSKVFSLCVKLSSWIYIQIFCCTFNMQTLLKQGQSVLRIDKSDKQKNRFEIFAIQIFCNLKKFKNIPGT